MTPTLHPGDIVVGWRVKPRVGAVVIARHAEREIIKRVKQADDKGYYLVGDNQEESTDSRHYGKINRRAILGTVMIIVKKPVNPPKPVKSYGVLLGRFAAVVLASMAIIHLFRIDTFIPILDEVLPGGSAAASLTALLVILSEVFAIPFALRMRLSPLAHFVSGTLLFLAPLWWVLISIWALGSMGGTGQLGEFVATPSTIWLVLVNAAWLVFNATALYALGYGRLSTKALKK